MDGGEGQRRHEDLGRPIVPSIAVDGDVVPLHHPSQIASVLGAPPPPEPSSVRRVAWDTVTILDDWLEMLEPLPWEIMLLPTPFRDRSVRNLTVNVFRPFAMLPESWESHRFDWWGGEADLQQEALLRDKDAVLGFARPILLRWQSFLLDNEEDIAAQDPMIGSNRGDVAYSTLLTTHRFHSANHHRQVVAFLADQGVDVSARLRTETFSEIGLPAEIY